MPRVGLEVGSRRARHSPLPNSTYGSTARRRLSRVAKTRRDRASLEALGLPTSGCCGRARGKWSPRSVPRFRLASPIFFAGGPTEARRAAIIDIVFVGAVSLTYLGMELLHVPKRWSFLVAGLVLLAYVVYLVSRRPHSW